jgi:hypothetical protein
LRVNRDSIVFGSDLPQAGPSQRNRPFIKFLPTDRFEMRNIIRSYLARAYNV